MEKFCVQRTQKNIESFSAEGMFAQCHTVFEAMGCFRHYCFCQAARHSPGEQDLERGKKKKLIDEMPKQYIKEKRYDVVDMRECKWWSNYRTDAPVNQRLRELLLFKDP